MREVEEQLDFATTEEYPKEAVKKVQEVSLRLMEKIVKIFHENNIDYIIAHGTLLGMIRHNGHFIPWDDDCDLFVFDWCYARAIELLRRELPDDMIVHNKCTDPIYWCRWTKIRDTHSDTYESLWVIDRKMKYHGICIDLLRATPMTRGRYRRYLWGKAYKEKKKELKANAPKKKNKKLYSKYKKRMKRFKFFGKLKLKFGSLLARFDRTKLIVANYKTIIEGSFKYRDVFPLQNATFEGVEVKIPRNPDGVLKALYGDYMEIPPFEERHPHFSSVEFFDE